MHPTVPLFSLLLLAAQTTATLSPASSNTKAKYPSSPACPAAKTSRAIQAAECSHNTRTASQTFAVFTTDHQYDSVPGAPYGTCEAYACAPGSNMVAAKDKWTFFWTGAGAEGEEEGDGAGCIKSPDDGQCGCEGSDGVFVPGGTDCV